MRNIIFNLSALSEMYLKQLNIRRHPAEGSLMLLEELNYRKLEKMLVKSFPQAEKEIESVKGEVTEYYYYKFLYNNHLQHYTNWSRFKNKNMKDYLNENISGGNIYLSHYFLIRTLANYRVFLVKEEAAPPEYD